MQSKIKKNDEKIDILNNEKQDKPSNEINFKRRTIENNTHESIEDLKIKRITSWRKSRKKFLNNLKYNILSFGILHLISLYYPNLYIKLYCNPWPAKECDFFLVENIYGQYTLCSKTHIKTNNRDIFNSDISKDKLLSNFNNINIHTEYNIIKNLTYSFTYKSVTYEYNEENNEIIAVYINLSNMTNKRILNFFAEGLSSEKLVKKYKEKYGKNEFHIDIKLPFLYFRKIEIPSFILVLSIGMVEFFVLKDYISLFIKSFVILIIFLIQLFNFYKMIIHQYEKNYTLDGEKNKLKVNRKYLIKDKNNFYAEIKNEDLLPGDIIYLKSNDFVPCDCILIEGECIVSDSNLNGTLNMYKKISLENNNTQFNYLYNNINILFHGMKIIKAFSKLKNGFISAICINTGSNTYKANQYSNILYFLERKKEYNEPYKFFGNRKKFILIYMILVFFLTFILGLFFLFQFQLTLNKKKLILLIYKIIIRALAKSLMAVYFITNNIMILLNLFRLHNDNIICFDKSRLLNSGNINTIFFNKTGALCHDYFEINGFHPLIGNNQNPNNITFKNFSSSQCKEINMLILDYYKEYLNKINNKYDNNPINITSLGFIQNQSFNKVNNKSSQYIALFLECLLSCNNIEKFNIELFGNSLEMKLFNDFNWNLEIYDEYNYNHINILYNKSKNKLIDDNKYNLFEKRMIDIYPKNYYKITENSKNKREKYIKFKENKSNNKNIINGKKNNFLKNEILMKRDSDIFNINEISQNIKLSKINSYKLRIFNKFIKNGTLNSSAIVYNFITSELRFMIKGMPEDILNKCDKNTFPENFDNIISFYRKNGFIIIVCATKLINIEEYNDVNDLNYYMNDLTFCGFITLKNKLKENIINTIQDLKKYNYNFILTSGDNEYNCLSLGFKCGIIENKNIYTFDKDDTSNKLTIKKIYKVKNYNEEDIKRNNLYEKNIKDISKINDNKSNSDLKKLKENSIVIENSPLTPQISRKIGKKEMLRISKKRSKLMNDNSEREKFNDSQNLNFSNNKEENEEGSNPKNSDLTSNNKNNINFNRNLKQKNTFMNEYNEYREFIEKNTFKRNISFISKNNNTKIKVNKSINCYETINYYPKIFKDYEELKDNCIYCISGKAFNFLYKNKKNKECKFLLEQIYKKCKIYFNISSIDKSVLIDFYRENPNNYICNIGECVNDIDSIITSHVGISLKNPNNQNTILFHFYSANNDISCIKKIIIEGRVLYENTLLLEFVSFLCTMALNSFIICCLLRNVDVIEGQLNFLEVEFLILSVASFTGEPKNNMNVEPLAKNNKLLKIYYYIELIGIMIIKLLTIYFFSSLYKSDYTLELEKRDKIFVSYYFILCIEYIICIVFSFNYISFFRKSPFSNFFLKFITFIIVTYILILVTLNSSNLRYDFFNITTFEFSNNLMDSFADKNRIWLILLCIFDFICSILFSNLVYFIFDKIAKNRLDNNKD